MRVLVIGYGNPGRLDDGLGPAMADAIAELRLPDVTVESDYQLNVEDAAQIAQHDVVIFADATVTGSEPFEFRRIEPGSSVSFTSHDVEPESVLGLAWRLFGAKTVGYVLAIRGYEFNDFGERLSQSATANLKSAVDFVGRMLHERNFEADCIPDPRHHT